MYRAGYEGEALAVHEEAKGELSADLQTLSQSMKKGVLRCCKGEAINPAGNL